MYINTAVNGITRSLVQASSLFFATMSILLLLFGKMSYAESESTIEHKPFTHQTVITLAKKLSQQPFKAPPDAPESLTSLDYSTYRQINFQQNAAIWGNSPSKFSIQLFAPGFLFKKLVDINIIEDGKSYPIKVTDSSFRVPEQSIAKTLVEVGKYAGFRLHYPLNKQDYKDEFVVFQGASYFRAVSKGQQYGLSARGLAIDVAEPQQGEEHPMFKRFWIERPSEDQQTIVVHALLDSKSVTGAYRFGIYPDAPTKMDVEVVLFPRRDLNHVGFAPLTSMFMYGPLVPPDMPDYRSAVHDSEALAIAKANGERLWRPLNNPEKLEISTFGDENPGGFGLIQRQRDFEHYQDLEANYHRRPSVWVEPLEDWGKGQVQLIEIPSDSETNDNIVAYWRPAGGLKKGEAFSYSYRLTWLDNINPMPNNRQIVRSAGGQKLFNDHREIVIDYNNLTAADIEHTVVNASINKGRILETRLQANPETGGGRVFVSFDAEGADVAELRVQLKKGDTAASETWLYRWIKPNLFSGE
ncbi:glucan biosynthesis protein G [Methylophaga sp. OBS4]|uniref:glucan biosynthesis protein G n=1 Tax=Methylophaga sp. OBS4 TaxID=2991935 RepID=UPI00224D26A7|nr:glucan biosynthesis protein G [Methylophaga sp. OBS4]MCX4188516.1 glucan biosynthesis protein G [Methylophaga sp. OBS4]